MKTKRAGRAFIPLLVGCLNATAVAAPSLELSPSSQLWLEGDSTLHAYSSTATRLELKAEFEPSTTALQAGTAARLELVVPVDGLHSGKSGLDKNMRAALKAVEYPTIAFRLERYRILSSSGPGLRVLAEGELFVAGASRPVELEADLESAPGRLRVRGSEDLLMTDFGIKPPSMFMGTVKTADKIVVHYDLVLDAKERRVP